MNMNAYQKPVAGGSKKGRASSSPAPKTHLHRALVRYAERHGKESLRRLTFVRVTDSELEERLNQAVEEGKDVCKGKFIEVELDGERFHGSFIFGLVTSIEWYYGKPPKIEEELNIQDMLEDAGENPRGKDMYDLALSRARRAEIPYDEHDERSRQIEVHDWDLQDMLFRWEQEQKMRKPDKKNEHDDYVGKDEYDMLLIMLKRWKPEAEGPAGMSAV